MQGTPTEASLQPNGLASTRFGLLLATAPGALWLPKSCERLVVPVGAWTPVVKLVAKNTGTAPALVGLGKASPRLTALRDLAEFLRVRLRAVPRQRGSPEGLQTQFNLVPPETGRA